MVEFCVLLLRILVIEFCGIKFHILSIIWFLWNIKNLFDILEFVLFLMFVAVFGSILFGSLENCDKGNEKVHRV